MGTVRLGNHELLIRLAAGGAANVFLVRDLEHGNRLLALKILLPSLAQNEDFLNMFFTEAKIASNLRHPNVVTIAGFGQVDGIHCLAMEYVFGASLSQMLRASARAKKPLTVGVLLRLTAAVCDALHYAHELRDEHGEPMGLVHRDVTPQNILLGFNGVPKLTDFGIAKATNRGWETQAGIVKGKFSYMSPEQALGKTVDRRSDIFGTGIVLWEALTGRDLFRGSTPMEVLAAIRDHKIEPPSKVVPGLTPIVDPIVMKALRRSPRQRYATAAEMRDDIEDLIQRAGVQIDSEAISREFAQIYGDDIARRAIELRRAEVGSADLKGLADALGGSVLKSEQLPMMKGGINNPDPLGIFSAGTADVVSEEAAPAAPARIERSFSGAPRGDIEDDFEIVDDDDDLLDMPEENPFGTGMDAPAVPDNRFVTGWDDSTSTAIPEDEILKMISDEDATVGFIPPKFAERFFGQVLEDARKMGDRPFEDEEGSPTASFSRLRAISSDESVSGIVPAPVEALVASGAASARGERPVPRAPSVLMEEAMLKDRESHHASPKDFDPGGEATADLAHSHAPHNNPSAVHAPAAAPRGPAAAVASSGSSAVIIRDEYAEQLLSNNYPAAEVEPPSYDDNGAVEPYDDELEDGHTMRSTKRPSSGAAPPLETPRSPDNMDDKGGPLPFGSYSFTRGSNKAWGGDAPGAPATGAPAAGDPGALTAAQATETAPRPEPVLRSPPPAAVESPPAVPRAADWSEPSPESSLLQVGRPQPELALLEVNQAEPLERSASRPPPPGEPSSRSPVPPPKSPVQLSTSMLLVLGIVLLIAGAALGALLGQRLN